MAFADASAKVAAGAASDVELIASAAHRASSMLPARARPAPNFPSSIALTEGMALVVASALAAETSPSRASFSTIRALAYDPLRSAAESVGWPRLKAALAAACLAFGTFPALISASASSTNMDA